ncbi:cell wall invertase [Carex littledalei]|uniref:Cell wall invertase n=1 Tax=Carex littledalei TaxID=544730 RepID=A0A833VPZ8_9POAL|nr:cell wall invertase [Carex littledalei]
MKGQALLYRSKDFKKWVKARHTLHAARGTGMWECPDFFPVAVKGLQGVDTSVNGKGVKHVLKVSLDLDRYEYYTIGTYDIRRDRFTPDGTSKDNKHGLRYDYGNFYASKTFYDPLKKRRILWGWANESDTVDEDNMKGWAGVQLIPRTVWLDPSGKQLLQWPVEELNSLRGKQISVKSKTAIMAGNPLEVKGIQTAQADVEVTFDVSGLDKAEPFDPKYMYDAQAYCKINGAEVKGGVGPFGLYVLATSDLQERTAVFFRVFKSEKKHVVLMCNDPTSSTLAPKEYKPTFAGYVDVDLTKSSTISLKTLLDNSVVESFGAKGKVVISSRVYPTLAHGDNAHLFIFNNGATDIKVTKLDAWELKKPLMNIGL